MVELYSKHEFVPNTTFPFEGGGWWWKKFHDILYLGKSWTWWTNIILRVHKNKWLINFVALLRVQDFKIQKNHSNFYTKIELNMILRYSHNTFVNQFWIWFVKNPKLMYTMCYSIFFQKTPMFFKSHHNPYIQFNLMEIKTNQHQAIQYEFEPVGLILLRNPLWCRVDFTTYLVENKLLNSSSLNMSLSD